MTLGASLSERNSTAVAGKLRFQPTLNQEGKLNRLSPLQRTEIPELNPKFDLVEAAMGFLPNSLLIMARRPELVAAFATLSATVMGKTSLPAGLSSLVAFVVSRSAGCQYCQAHTHHQAANAGIDAEKLDDVWLYETSPRFSEGERAALRVAQGAAQVPNAVTDEDFAALRVHFDENQILDIVAIISLFGFLNRWNDTLATELESAPIRHAEEHLAARGWTGAKHR